MALPAWFLKAKGLQTTRHYRQMQDAAHARAFTVVRVAQLNALAQIKKDLIRAIEGGQSFTQFKKDYQGQPLRAHHLKTVYQTNLQSAFMAGRFTAALQASETHPYWLYLAEMDAHTRDNHAQLHGKAFRFDDPIWQTITPPNGYNCRCRIVPLSEADLSDWGATVAQGNPRTMQPDKGFNNSPMASHVIDSLLATRAAETLGQEAARAFIQSTLTHPARQKGWAAFVSAVLDTKALGQSQVMAFGLLPKSALDFVQKQGVKADSSLVFLNQSQFAGKKGRRHSEAGNAPTHDELKNLPNLFTKDPRQSGGLILWDTQDKLLVYLFKDSGKGYLKVPVRFNRLTYDGQKGLPDVASLFWVTPNDVNSLGMEILKNGAKRYLALEQTD